MIETYRFLKEETQVNYLATIDGNKPSNRPFEAPVLFEGKIYILTKKHKNVSKQIEKNNNVCIVAYNGDKWLRINCELMDDSDNIEAKKAIMNEFSWAEEEGYTLDNPDFQILYLANANSTIYDEDGCELEKYLF